VRASNTFLTVHFSSPVVQSPGTGNELSLKRIREKTSSIRLTKKATAALILAILLIIVTLQVVRYEQGPVTIPMSGLHVQRNRIVDENGLPVILRGVTIDEQCDDSYFSNLQRFDEADMAELVQVWHVNVIRVPILPDLWQSCSNYFQNILDPIVNLGSKYRVYVLLGWHAHGNPITGQVEHPSWGNQYPYHGNPYNPNMTLATSFWNATADRYKNDPWVIYSIWNEPAYITWTNWRPIAEQLVGVVRSHNPNSLILVPGVSWAYDLRGAYNDPVNRTNIVYETHVYPMFDVVKGPWDQYFGYLATYHPVFVGEWGFHPGDPDPELNGTVDNFGKLLVTYMARNNMSWTAFCWSTWWLPSMLNSSSQPTDYGQFVQNVLITGTVANQTSQSSTA